MHIQNHSVIGSTAGRTNLLIHFLHKVLVLSDFLEFFLECLCCALGTDGTSWHIMLRDSSIIAFNSKGTWAFLHLPWNDSGKMHYFLTDRAGARIGKN